MIEKRYVTLKVYKELEVEIDNDEYEYEKIWVGDIENGYYSSDRHIDEEYVRDLILELVPDDIDGWEVLEAYVDQ